MRTKDNTLGAVALAVAIRLIVAVRRLGGSATVAAARPAIRAEGPLGDEPELRRVDLIVNTYDDDMTGYSYDVYRSGRLIGFNCRPVASMGQTDRVYPGTVGVAYVGPSGCRTLLMANERPVEPTTLNGTAR